MLTELLGKGGCLCQPAKKGELRCPLIVRPTSEDVITGYLFQTLGAINPRWWLAQLLNEALGAKRFRQQCFRRLKIELWKNQPPYPRELLPWDEGSTQVDASITWENPPTTIFVEAKFGANFTPKAKQDNGQSGFPSDQLTRNVRVGLLKTGYFHDRKLFEAPARDFVLIVISPHADHELVTIYRDPERLRPSIPHSHLLKTLPRLPFIGQLSYPSIIRVLEQQRRWMDRTERILAGDLVEYLRFKLARVPARRVSGHRISDSSKWSTDMLRQAMANEAVDFRVQVAYPAPIFEDLDDLIERLAQMQDGTWVGSGVGFVDQHAERDIELRFNDEQAAKQFVKACSFLVGVRVLSVEHDE